MWFKQLSPFFFECFFSPFKSMGVSLNNISLSGKLSLIFSLVLISNISLGQTYQFSTDFDSGGWILSGTNQVSTVYTEGTKDPLLLTMREEGDIDCEGPWIKISGGKYILLGCGISNQEDYDKVLEVRKNNGDSFNAEEVFITPNTYRPLPTSPYELLLNVYIRGFKNGVQKGEIHLTNLVHAQVYPIDFSGYTGFDDLDMLYFFVDNQELFIDDLTLSSLTQAPVLPTLSTSSASGILNDQAALGGDITNDGGAPVTSRGVVWSTSTNPTISSNRVNIGTGSGSFSATVTGLPTSTTIFVRAFGVNSAGVAYGNQISFTTPSNLIAQILSVTKESCLGNDGAISLGAIGGTPPYSYLWLFDNSTLSSRNDLTAGSYTIRVFDSAGDEATTTVNLGTFDPLVLTPNLTQVSCAEGNDGAASVTVTGGTGVYTYSWSVAGETGSSIENLVAGNYSVTVSDQSGCQTVQNFTISEPTPLSVSIVSVTDVTCIGGNNGASQISVTGGSPPYTYSWTPENVNSPANFNLSAGTYQVLVSDANFCQVTQTVTIDEPDLALLVNTGSATDVLATSARVSGSAEMDMSGFGESESCVAKAGFVYSTTPNPDFTSGTVAYVNPFSLSGFSGQLSNLRPNSIHYVRAFVENTSGSLTYGNEQSFTTSPLSLSIGGSFSVKAKDYDGNTSAEISDYSLVLSGLDPAYNQVELENVVVEFETGAAGINKPVKIVSADITGPDAERYNFSLLNSPTSTGTVFKKNLSLTGLAASSKTYDALTDAIVTGVPGISEVVDGDEVILSGTPEYNFLTTNSGQNLEISTTGFLLSGTDAPNYELVVTALFADILKRQLLMEDPIITTTKVFDGLRQAAFTIGNPINLVSGDDLTVTGSAQYDNASVGSGKQIEIIYTLSGNSAENYLAPLSFQRTDGEITPAELLVTVSGETKEFGDLDPVFSLQYSGFVFGDDASLVLGSPSFTRDSGEDVGNYSVGVLGLSSPNYSLQIIPGNLEITQRSMQITLPFLTKEYGNLDPIFTYTTDPVQGALLPNGLRVELNGSLEREPGEDIGDYIIDIGTIKDLNPNYLIGYVGGILSIVPRKVEVTADAKSKTYGELDPVLTYTSIPAVGETLANGLVVSIAGEPQRQAGETIGTYLITKGTLASPNFDIVFQDAQFEIDPLALEIRVDPKTKVFGELDPVLSFTALPALGTVLSNGEVVSLTGNLLRNPGENVGSYAIGVGTLSNPNLVINFEGSNLEITPLQVSVSAIASSKLFGEADPALTFVSVPAVGSGLPNGEVVSLTGGLVRNPGEDVGTYAIGQGTVSNPNLSISFIGSILTITKKQVTVLAAKKTKFYGEIDPVLTFSTVPELGSILPNGEVLSFIGNLSRALGEQVGSYEIGQGSLSNPNYEIAFTGEELEITPLEVRVNAEDLQKVYGDLDPGFKFTSIPSVGSVLPNGLKIAFTGSLSRAEGENVGFYDIEKGTLSNPNFQVVFQKAQLEIKILPIQVSANSQSKKFGELDPQLTYSSLPAAGSFLENGQVVSFFGNLLRAPGENIGSYPIQQGELSNPNYQIEFTSGLFTINPLSVRILANEASKVYGESDPPLTFTASPQPARPLPNGQVFTLSGTLSRNPGENVGTYSINQGSLSSPNIQFDFVGANFSILPKNLDIIPLENQRKVYGDQDPNFEFRINGLLQRDPITIVSGALGRVQGEAVGAYKFTMGNLTAGANYRLVLQEEEFRIESKGLIIRAETKEKRYGDPNPELTYVIEGLVNGEQGIDQLPVISTPANQASSVGTYPIELSGGADPNYTVTLINAELRVLRRNILVKAEDKEMSYGDQVPALTYSYVGLVNGDQDLESMPTLATGATSNSNVGTYPIKVSGGGDPNYVLEYQNGLLSIRPRVLEVIADSKKRDYGDPNPVLTYTLSGLVNGDLDLTSKPDLNVSANPDSFVGNYPIRVSGGNHPNYSLIHKEGVLEIVPASLRVTALPSGKVFGAADPELNYIASGFKLSDGIGLGIGKLARAAGEAVAKYPITVGTLSFGNNYKVQFETADFEIVPVQILAITDPVGIQTPWGAVPEFPDQVQVVTQDGRIITMNVIWNEQELNVFARGGYFIKGQVVIGDGLTNPSGIFPTLQVTVLPKPAPQDLLLSNNRFIPDPDNFFQAIGNFSVVDPLDNVHSITLAQPELDNGFFEIKENILFWSSSDEASGKSQFSIRVQVTDRDGNTLVKDFTIIRERVVLSSLEVYNSFSPNGDGFNDTWGVPDLRYYKNVRVHIYNVEGRRVFYTEDPDFRWNGTFNGEDLATETFQWVIEIEETGEKRNGYLHLIR